MRGIVIKIQRSIHRGQPGTFLSWVFDIQVPQWLQFGQKFFDNLITVEQMLNDVRHPDEVKMSIWNRIELQKSEIHFIKILHRGKIIFVIVEITIEVNSRIFTVRK